VYPWEAAKVSSVRWLEKILRNWGMIETASDDLGFQFLSNATYFGEELVKVKMFDRFPKLAILFFIIRSQFLDLVFALVGKHFFQESRIGGGKYLVQG
jgi:hypothetical protein